MRYTVLATLCVLASGCSVVAPISDPLPKDDGPFLAGNWHGTGSGFELKLAFVQNLTFWSDYSGTATLVYGETHQGRALELVYPWGRGIGLRADGFGFLELHVRYPDASTMSGYLVKRREGFPHPAGDYESVFVGDSIAIVLRR
ncbi:MAG TPA: hypothetical protein VM099_08025 [Gemmatimonadaceae bacterium]|nr:hypothetical protein [Gemmatimonadaceae bacterium]